MDFIFVALGGGLGACLRYAISLIPIHGEFPALTLLTNIFGAIAIGFIAGIFAESGSSSTNLVLFFKTGVCGGFTTFSTFSLEAYHLFEKSKYAAGTAYVALSIVLCLAGVWCGGCLAKMIKG